MKRLIIAAVGLALVVGVVVGGMVGNPFGGKASASAALVTREDQITIYSEAEIHYGSFGEQIGMPGSRGPLTAAGPLLLAVDPSDYPPSSTFRLEGVWNTRALAQGCLRLFDRTEEVPVSTSEACLESDGGDVRVRSSPFSLAAGEHEYTLQGQCTPSCPNSGVYSARLIVEWSEPMAVGGIAELPPLASAPGGSGMGGTTYAVLVGALAGALAALIASSLYVRSRLGR